MRAALAELTGIGSGGPRLTLVDVGAERPANVAVTSIEASTARDVAGVRSRFEVGISNFSDTAVADAELRLSIADQVLPPLILPHLFRPVSLWLLAPGVIVQPTVPQGFATGTAYGDLVVTVLALVAVLLVRGERRGAVVAAWVFNVAGFVDALRNCVVGIVSRAPVHMGAAALVPAFAVPLLLASHVLVFAVLRAHRRNRARCTG